MPAPLSDLFLDWAPARGQGLIVPWSTVLRFASVSPFTNMSEWGRAVASVKILGLAVNGYSVLDMLPALPSSCGVSTCRPVRLALRDFGDRGLPWRG